jgi:hypothetical protein
MIKPVTITIGLLASTPSYACHHFSVWNYPYRQNCKTNTIEVIRYAPKEPVKSPLVDLEITQPPPEVSPQLIETLKVLLNTNSAYMNRIPDIPVDILLNIDPANISIIKEMEMEIGEDTVKRMKALEELKERMNPLPQEQKE